MPKFSRDKGRREEQQLVLHLAKLGFKAERILRQYQVGGQPDVKATKDGKTWTFENKARKASFKRIYELYYSQRGYDGCLRYTLNFGGAVCVAASTELEPLMQVDHGFPLVERAFDEKQLKPYRRLAAMRELKQDADFLVIKDNGKPRLFIRYW